MIGKCNITYYGLTADGTKDQSTAKFTINNDENIQAIIQAEHTISLSELFFRVHVLPKDPKDDPTHYDPDHPLIFGFLDIKGKMQFRTKWEEITKNELLIVKFFSTFVPEYLWQFMQPEWIEHSITELGITWPHYKKVNNTDYFYRSLRAGYEIEF